MTGTQIQRRRGTTAQHSTFTGALGELTVDTDKKTVVVHDGSTAGGSPLAVAATVAATYAPLASPALTGTPTAPTAAQGTNTTQVATTAFVQTGLAGKANLASPALTGTPTAPTAAAGTNNTQIATTAFAKAEAASAAAAVAPSFASSAENAAGTVENKAVDPLGIREALNATGSAPVYACRAWVNFNGTGTVAIRASGNVSSITDNGVGNYRVNFATAMPDTHYALCGFIRSDLVTPTAVLVLTAGSSATKTTSAVDVLSMWSYGGGVGLTDTPEINVEIFR